MKRIDFSKSFNHKIPIIYESYSIDEKFIVINISQNKSAQDKKDVNAQITYFKKIDLSKRRVNRKKMVQKTQSAA